jgi:hypothetical protein
MSGLSESLRFSISDLLYYAPRFTEVGDALARAEENAGKRLDSLGAFWGKLWPDTSFAENYEPAQYATLLVTKAAATELQGIGSGLATMAKRYGIAEDDIKHEIGKINQARTHEDQVINLEGGPLSPPDVPSDRIPEKYHRTVPQPRPGKRPTPQPTSPSHPSTPPTPPPTPRPRAGVDPDREKWRRNGDVTLLGPCASGDVSKLEEAANVWRDLVRALDDAWADTQKYVNYVLSENEGPAAEQFAEYSRGLVDRRNGALTLALQAAEHARDACTNYAQAIRDLENSIRDVVAGIIATFLVDVAVSELTFQTSDELTAQIETGLLARLSQIVELFVEEGKALSSPLAGTVRTFASIAAKSSLSGAKGVASAALSPYIGNAIDKALGHDSPEATASLKDLLDGGASGALDGFLGGTADEAAKAVKSLSEAGGPAADDLANIARGLGDKSLPYDTAKNMIQQLIQNGQIDPKQLAAAAISSHFSIG